jgi:ppGpp synthetase/RelA/SpoT-type nucleotidyltranferase
MEGTAPRPNVSRNQLSEAGTRVRRALRDGQPIPENVLRAIDEFRAWHLPTLQEVQRRISAFFNEEVGIDEESLPVTSRLKTPPAIIAKLNRTRTSLERMQDISGARIIVPSLRLQEMSLSLIETTLFRGAVSHVKDQREEPDQYGYRAIHAIVRVEGRIAEIQIRTTSQDRWAQIVESLDSSWGYDLKHGRGPAEWLEWLHAVSDELRQADLDQPFEIPPQPYDEPQEGDE